jgi:putative transposase
MYPVVFFDALRVKIREDAVVRNKAIYLALGVLPDGTRDILGLWIEKHRGRQVLDEGLQRPEDPRRGNDILIAVTDGLKGMPRRWGGVPGHHAADLHRAPDPQQPGLRQLEGPQALAAAIKPIYTAPPVPRPPWPN